MEKSELLKRIYLSKVSNGLKVLQSNPSWYLASIEAIEEYHRAELLKLNKSGVIGSALPQGFKVYKCTDCSTVNVLHDNKEVTVGFCSKCEHPLWND